MKKRKERKNAKGSKWKQMEGEDVTEEEHLFDINQMYDDKNSSVKL